MPSRKKTSRRPKRLPHLVYFSIPEYGGITFMDRDVALGRLHRAFARGTARTWGEYRALDPVGAECDAETYNHEEGFATFFEFCVSYRQKYGELDYDDAWNRYRALSLRLRPPLDEDAFDLGELLADMFELGHAEQLPSVAMNDLLPDEILDCFAEIGDGIWDGPHVVIDSDCEQEIVAALRALGYEVTRDDTLVLLAFENEEVDAERMLAMMVDERYRAGALPAGAGEFDLENDVWGVFE